MDCHSTYTKSLLIWILSMVILLALVSNTKANGDSASDKIDALQFDSIIELNAPLCRTHVVLFARYWVSPKYYRMAIVWGEPHAGSLNFPIFPRSLNVASDPEAFRIEHQFRHMYDGVYPRPIGQRGPFHHQFNSYYFSDVRFAEQDALDMRIYSKDIKPLKKTGIYDVNFPESNDESGHKPVRLSVRAANDRLDEIRLFNIEGKLLKSIEYQYKDGGQLNKQIVFLPERPIKVGFKGKGPSITIGGEEQQYSELQTTHHQGGRKCIVDYQTIEIAGHTKILPFRITVYSPDGNRVLRSAKLYNFSQCQISTDQLEKIAKRFSFLDDNETICREMLLKYWLKAPAEVVQDDVKTLEQISAHIEEKSTEGMTPGQQLRRVNMLLQLDWMLGYMPELESNFREYLSLLVSNELGRMILVGGQNAIEMTSRWDQFDTADRLLEIWLDVAISHNDVDTVLNFAADSIRKNNLWTTAGLMVKSTEKYPLSEAQRFVTQAIRCLCLERLCEMLDNPDGIKNELDATQVGWVSRHTDAETIRKSTRQGIIEAKQLFANLNQPTREQKVLRVQLEKLQPL